MLYSRFQGAVIFLLAIALFLATPFCILLAGNSDEEKRILDLDEIHAQQNSIKGSLTYYRKLRYTRMVFHLA